MTNSQTHMNQTHMNMPRRIFMTDEYRDCLEPNWNKLAIGDAIIFRHYGHAQRGALAQSLAKKAKTHGLLFFVAGDPYLAKRVHADGLHLPGHMLKGGHPTLPQHMIITAAVHDMRALGQAKRRGVDGIIISPVFPTASHPEAQPLGLHILARMADLTSLPTYALGGVTEKNCAHMIAARRIYGVAGISTFC